MSASLVRVRPLTSVASLLFSSPKIPGSSNERPQKRSKADPWASIFNDLPVVSDQTHAGIRNKFKFKSETNSNSGFFTSNTSRSLASKPSGANGKRGFKTSARKEPGSNESSPIREEDDSAWDHIFANIDEDIAMSQKHMPSERNPNKRPIRTATPSTEHGPAIRYSRRPPMTASEKNAFDSMFEMIFRATTQKKENFTTVAVQLPLENRTGHSAGWSWLQHSLPRDIDVSGSSSNDPESRLEPYSQMSSNTLPLPYLPPDTYGKLRNLPKRTTELDQLLDEKKEEVGLCHSDLEVLEWAVRELFGESDPQKAPSASTSSRNAPLPPALYAPLLTHLIHYFISPPRYNYHTALALFAYAKTLSPTSYVFGCNTSAYNVYLQARWAVEQDSSEMLAILQEMDANGVNFDSETRKLFKRIRRDVETVWGNSEELFHDLPDSEKDSNPFLNLEKAEQIIEDGRRMRSPNISDKFRVDQKYPRGSGYLQLGEEDGLTLK